MKKANLLLLLLVTATSIIYGQTTIKGTITDSETNKPIGAASVSIKAKNSDFFDGATADLQGQYSVSGLPKDTLSITVSYMGYVEYTKLIVNHGTQDVMTLDFELSNNVTLGEVSVESMKSQMRFELDKKVFDVSASAITSGASVSDILQNIPSVEVTTEGSIALRGSESVIIWINGKPAGLNTENQSQILEQIPAETIERVEIITNPSSKHSPEGTAGIINIILKQGREAGYYGSVMASISNRLSYNLNANINYNSDKLDLFGSIGYLSRHNESSVDIDRTMTASGLRIGSLQSSTKSDGRGSHIFTRLGGTYRPSTKDEFSLSAFGMLGQQKDNNIVNQSSNSNSIFNSERNTDGSNKMLGGNITLGYKRTFDQRQTLDLTADYNQWNMAGDTYYIEKGSYDFDADSSADSLYITHEQQKANIINRSLNFKADYTNILANNHKLEAGYNGSANSENSPSDTYTGTTADNMVINPLLSNDYLYKRLVNAIYVTYSGAFGKFNYQAGLRGEHTYTQMTSRGYESIDNNYFDLFPSLFLNYEWQETNQLQLNYTRRISRPNGWQLNPFKNISDSKNIRFGNPSLTPEYSNALELNYIKTWQSHILSFSGYFRNTTDVIQRISYLDQDVMYNTSENVASTMSAGTEIVVKNNIKKFLNLTTTVNLFYYHLDGFDYEVPGVGYHVIGNPQEDFSWNVRMMAQAMLPKGFILQLTGGYSAPRAVAQGTMEGNFSLDGGIRKTIGNFTFNLNARDILNSRGRTILKTGENFTQSAKMRRGIREITLSVTYAFGSMNQKNGKRSQQQSNSDSQNQGLEIVEGSGLD